MAYHDARTLNYRTLPLVRRELDKQLTAMVLVHVLIIFCTFLSFSIVTTLKIMNVNPNDPVFVVKLNLALNIASIVFLLSYAV
jgi:hypothetical protein